MHPYRFLLYPLVGFLPEEEQERTADRLGLYSVTATMVSGLVEADPPVRRGVADHEVGGRRPVVVVRPPEPEDSSLFALSGLGRAFAAVAFHETSGPYLVELAFATR